MDADRALDFVNDLLRKQGLKDLSYTESIIFKEVWDNPLKNYNAIACNQNYAENSLKTIASSLWQRLHQVFGVEVRKKRLRVVVEEYKRKQEQAVLALGADPVAEIGLASLDSSSSGNEAVDSDNENDYTRSVDRPPLPSRLAQVDWGECPDTSIFFGREQELATLQQWLVADRCRVVALLGMGGIGKTSLAAKLMDQMQGAFDYVIWRSLREAPPLDEILVRLIQFVSAQQETELSLPTRLGERLNRLVDYLRERRCLLVLDNAEAIFQEGSAGQYRQGYEGYGELFKRLGEATHQSCLLLTSREKPRELAVLEGVTLPVRCWPVGGIEAAAGLAILQVKGVRLAEDGAQGDDLIRRWGGNPQILRLVAAEIQDLFAGDVADFLRERVTAQEDVRGLLAEQFSRLAPLERSVMYWLMINREPITVDELLEDLLPPVSRREVRQALRGLVDRSLIEAVDKQFTLQNVIMEYLTDRFVEQVGTELETQQFDYFHNHALIKAIAKDYVRETQIRLILKPIASHISNLEQKIKKSLEIVRQNSNWSNGYSPGNLLNLLCQFQAEARSFDFSSLTLRQAHLKGMQLHTSDLANSDFIHSSLTQTFSVIHAIAFSPDGELMATGDGNGNIQLWRVRDQESLGTLSGHTNEVRSVAFSPDGQYLASGSEDATIRLWDLQTRQCLHTFSDHTDRVRSVTFSPDGQCLASGSGDATIRLWDLQTRQCRHTFSGYTHRVWSVAFSPDGQCLASGDDATIRLWYVQTGKCLATLQIPRPYEGTNITGIKGLTAAEKASMLALGAVDHDSEPSTKELP